MLEMMNDVYQTRDSSHLIPRDRKGGEPDTSRPISGPNATQRTSGLNSQVPPCPMIIIIALCCFLLPLFSSIPPIFGT